MVNFPANHPEGNQGFLKRFHSVFALQGSGRVNEIDLVYCILLNNVCYGYIPYSQP